MFRFLLILFLLYLIIRYMRLVVSPRKKDDSVKGQARKPRMDIPDDRVTDVTFKDLPKDDK